MTQLINGIPKTILLDTIARLEIAAEACSHADFDDLLQDEPLFIRQPIEQIMAQPGYPDNIDWDSVIEDGGLGY